MADSPTQWVWADMKRRCLEPHRRGYQNYGGRGIRVCDRWLNGDGTRGGFECFLSDMGPRPSKDFQIERGDNDGNYEPGNCRWALKAEQDYNKRTTFRFTAFGVKYNLREAALKFGLPMDRIYTRITRSGWTGEDAVTKKIRGT